MDVCVRRCLGTILYRADRRVGGYGCEMCFYCKSKEGRSMGIWSSYGKLFDCERYRLYRPKGETAVARPWHFRPGVILPVGFRRKVCGPAGAANGGEALGS